MLGITHLHTHASFLNFILLFIQSQPYQLNVTVAYVGAACVGVTAPE